MKVLPPLLFFIENCYSWKTYKRESGSELQVTLERKKIVGRSSLRFLAKCAGGSLISARPFCHVDNASDRSSNAIAWEFLLA